MGGVPAGRCAKQDLGKKVAKSAGPLHLEMAQHLRVFSTILPGG
jgi:hypothetical protein